MLNLQTDRLSQSLRGSSEVEALCPLLSYDIPDDYKAVELPQYLRNIRRCIFGQSPDGLALAVRTTEMLRFIWSTPVKQLTYALDSRPSWNPVVPEGWLLAPSDVTVTSGNTAPSTVTFSQPTNDPSDSGIWVTHYSIEPLGGTSVRVRRTFPARIDNTYEEPTETYIDLPFLEEGFTARLTDFQSAPTFNIRVIRRGMRNWSEIVNNVDKLVGDLTQLFADRRDEPYATFQNLWKMHENLPHRVAGLALAIAYRTEELRAR